MDEDASAFVTPARRPRQQQPRISAGGAGDGSGAGSATGRRGSRRGSSLLGSGIESELTPGGAQILHAGLKRSGRALALQVLGVYRYVADPALRRVLPPLAADALEWDVFDLVVSDGQMKIKALLSPALNHLVWRGLVGELDIVEIDDYELLRVPVAEPDVDAEDDGEGLGSTQPMRDVCIIHELVPRPAVILTAAAGDDVVPSATHVAVAPRAKIVYSVGDALLGSPSPSVHGSASAVPDVQFVSEAHIRDHGALPLVGGRLYYLAQFSDDYPADWEPVKRESLSPVSLATPWAEWNRRRRYCTDIFTSADRTLHSIQAVNRMTSSKKRAASEMENDDAPAPPPPPMIGFVRFKSGLVHVGSPNVANPFPFMFHIVLSDRDRSVEVAFFGSMAAKNFLVVQEGDLLQVQGYTISRGLPGPEGKKPRKLFVFPHLSSGVVSHVPDKYWSLLETMKVLEKRPRKSSDSKSISEQAQRQEPSRSTNQSTVWFHPTFLTVADTQVPDLFSNDKDEDEDEGDAEAEADDTYFDFVGVVSYVGRMHRHRPPRDGSNPDSVEHLQAYRWIKLIDCTSKNELVVRLCVNSQPTGFHAIQAGDVAMLSKLLWVNTRQDGEGLNFASSSAYTTIRLKDDLEQFQVFTECSDIFAFAKELQANGGVKTVYSAVDSFLVATTESWLDGAGVEGYEPLHEAISMLDAVPESLSILKTEASPSVNMGKSHWIPAFSPSLSIPQTEDTNGIGYNYPFDEVHAIAQSMDALSHRYIRVHVALHGVRAAPSTSSDIVPEIEFLVTDGEVQDRPPQPVRLAANCLFKERELPSPLDEMVAADAEPLARLLTPAAVKSLNTASMLRSTELPHFSPAKGSVASLESEQEITLETVKEYILKSRKGAEADRVGGIDIALHLYRMPHGEVDLWVDAISL